jgi:hypothetical protein
MDNQNDSITNTFIIQPILYTEVFTLIRSLNEQKEMTKKTVAYLIR